MHSSSHPSKPNQAKQYRRCWSPSWARSTRGKNREFKGKDRLQKNGKDGDQNYKFFPDISSCYGLLIYISILWQHVFDMADFSVLLLYSLKSNNNNVMKEKKRSNLVISFSTLLNFMFNGDCKLKNICFGNLNFGMQWHPSHPSDQRILYEIEHHCNVISHLINKTWQSKISHL